jgi:hypothetical protein
LHRDATRPRVDANGGRQVLVVHATRKLLDRVGKPTVEPATPSTTRLGSWYATAMFWRPQVALFVNEATLLPVLMPLAPAANLLERFNAWLDRTLEAHDVPRSFIDAELAGAGEISLAKTNSRTILGVMNEFARLADWRRDEVADEHDLVALAVDLAPHPHEPALRRSRVPGPRARRHGAPRA